MEQDQELQAMQQVLDTLSALTEEGSKERVLQYVAARLGIEKGSTESPTHRTDTTSEFINHFATFADLFNAYSPGTNADRALIAGYWLQVNEGLEQFTSQAANKLLQDLGYSVANITDAFTQLYNKTPRLALQVRKTGKSQQARKQYKLTQAGIDMVQARLRGTI